MGLLAMTVFLRIIRRIKNVLYDHIKLSCWFLSILKKITSSVPFQTKLKWKPKVVSFKSLHNLSNYHVKLITLLIRPIRFQ